MVLGGSLYKRGAVFSSAEDIAPPHCSTALLLPRPSIWRYFIVAFC